MHRVHCRHHGVQPREMRDQRIVQQHLHDGRGIGEARRFHQHAVEAGNVPRVALGEQTAQGFLQVAAHRAADATIGHHRDLAADGRDQQVVEADFPELVDDHRAVGHAGMAQNVIEQGRLAAAQKARDQRHRHAFRGFITIEQ